MKIENNIIRQYNGFIILAQDEKDYNIKVNKINRGDTNGFYTNKQLEQAVYSSKYFVGCDPFDSLNRVL